MSDDIRYAIDLGSHVQHLVTVTLRVPAELADGGARLVLPTWTPGSYVERNYVHHVQQVRATDPDGADVEVVPDGHTAWRLPAGTRTEVDVTFELYANDLTVRTNHVDDHHALLVGAATFPFIDGATDRPHTVGVTAPDGWRVWSLLPEEDGRYVADDYDHLVDSAFEAGDHPEVSFEVDGVEHRFVWTAHGGRPDLDRLREEAQAVCRTAHELVGGDLPVDRYTFLCVGWDRTAGGGGLEHRDGSVLMMPVTIWGDEPDRYASLPSLIAHEYFHLWNVKRLTPRALVQPDYEHPTHTESLWVAEGWTAYIDNLVPVRAGVWDVDRFLEQQRKLADALRDSPGRRLQSVRRASHDAWTKLYVRDENSPNASVSYYALGHYLAWCLDLELRRRDPQGDGLDAVFRLLWERHRDDGYTEQDVQDAVAEIAGERLDDFFEAHVAGTELPDVDPLLEHVGLRWQDDEPDQPPPPQLRVQTTEDDQGVTITTALRDGPAWRAGVTGGDRLVAIDGLRVGRDELTTVLRRYDPGDTVEIAVFRGPRLLTLPVTLDPPTPARKLVRVDAPSLEQRDAFERWLQRPFASGTDDADDADDADDDEAGDAE